MSQLPLEVDQESSPVKKSFIREWGALIAFGVSAVVLIVGFRFWTEYQQFQPVAPVYQRYLDHLTTISSKAAAYQVEYHKKFERTSVASIHYLFVCGAMTRLAESEGKDPAAFSADMALGCKAGWPPSYEFEPLPPKENEPPIVRTIDSKDLK